MTNQPYIKEYNEFGEVINEITKEKPYLHSFNKKPNKRVGKYLSVIVGMGASARTINIKKNGNNKKMNTLSNYSKLIRIQEVNGKRISHLNLN